MKLFILASALIMTVVQDVNGQDVSFNKDFKIDTTSATVRIGTASAAWINGNKYYADRRVDTAIWHIRGDTVAVIEQFYQAYQRVQTELDIAENILNYISIDGFVTSANKRKFDNAVKVFMNYKKKHK